MTTLSAAVSATGDRIQTRAREHARTFHLGRFLLLVLAVVPFVVGWLAYRGYRVVVLAGSWIVAAGQEGWASARGDSSGSGP